MNDSKLTWSWLGGFYQAEGCVSNRRLNIEQKEREPLELIVQFLMYELPNIRPIKVRGPLEHHTPATRKPTYIHSMTLPKITTAKVLHKLLPHIHTNVRHKIIKDTNLQCVECPLNDDWIAGFWEGDGSIFPASIDVQIAFAQKDKVILEEIRKYLTHYTSFGNGTIYDYKYPQLIGEKYPSFSVPRLIYHCSMHNQEMLEWLFRNVRSKFRQLQLGTFLDAIRLYHESSPSKPSKLPNIVEGVPKDFLPGQPYRMHKWFDLHPEEAIV